MKNIKSIREMKMLIFRIEAPRLKKVSEMVKVSIAALTSAMLVTGGIYLIGTSRGIPLASLTGDPAMVTHSSILIGVLSNIGMMLWAGASVCAFLGAALQRDTRYRFWFLFASGLFSAFLAIDDLLTLHEHVLPHYLHVPESIAYFGYLSLAAIYLIYFLKEILYETDYPILAISLLFLGISLVSGKILPASDLSAFAKDSLKFLGIIFWLVYFFSTVLHLEKGTIRSQPSRQ